MKLVPIVYVTDMPRAVAFYDALGLQLKSNNRDSMWFEMGLGTAILALHKVDAVPEQKGQRMMLTFLSEEPLENFIDKLKSADITTTDIIEQPFGRSFQLHDPDGLMLIVCYTAIFSL